MTPETTPPLFGLVLAGGASTRMQQDKAALDYHGRPQLQVAFELLAPLCVSTFVSVRPDQRTEPLRAHYPQIVDREPGTGPIAGIAAALAEHPEAAWLVVACDLPFLTDATVRHLIGRRDPRRIATAYRSRHDGLPEPLCAIWEPAAREPLRAYATEAGAAGKKICPRKFLIGADVLQIDLPLAQALDNVNTREELGVARERLGAKTLRIQYYAILREQAGRSEETLDTRAATPAELYEELRQRHRFKLAANQLKVALNMEFSEWTAPLAHGDTVVFIPPVAGG